MTAIVLVAVMVDRPALTMRNLALAALGVMLLAPEAVVHPSFHMSFAATLALIAVYERGMPWTTDAEASHDEDKPRPRSLPVLEKSWRRLLFRFKTFK